MPDVDLPAHANVARGRFLSPRSLRRGAMWTGLIAAIALLVLSPMLRLQYLAFADGASAYKRLWDYPDLRQVIGFTLILGVGSVLIALVFGTVMAWFAFRLNHRQRWLAIIPLLPLVMPPVASVIGWTFLLSPEVGYVNRFLRYLTWWSDAESGPIDVYSAPMIVILTGINLTAFVYLFVITSLRNMNAELFEAAEAAGASNTRLYLKVILPLLRPSLVYSGGLVLLLGLGQFTAPLLLGRQYGIDVLTTEMFRQTQEFPVDIGLAAALSSPLILMGILLLVLQRRLIGDPKRFVSQTGKQVRSIGGSRSAPIPLLLFAAITLLLPVLALLHVSLIPYWSGHLSFDSLTFDNFHFVLFDNPSAWNGIVTSIIASLIAMAICLPITFAMAMLIRDGADGRVGKILLDALSTIPLVIPAVIFGAGILFTYSEPPFSLYGSMTIILIAYVTLMLPHSTRLLSSGLLSLGEQYFEASRVSGAGLFRNFFQVAFPLMRPSIGASMALMFVMLSHEFGASLFVRSTNTNLMGTVVYDLWYAGTYPGVAALAIIMCAVTGLGTAVAFIVGGARAFENL